MSNEITTQVVVIGAGPGGYPAAFHAADLGMDVVLIDRSPAPGGVCLYRGCIPSKALLHAAQIMETARTAKDIGLTFSEPELDFSKLQKWKDSVVTKLTGGLGSLTKARGIKFIQGNAVFSSSSQLVVTGADGELTTVNFEHAILATGSTPVMPGFIPKSDSIVDSTGALNLDKIPETMLVMGGGYIGLELGQVYASLGTEVTVVEMQASLLPTLDQDLVKVLKRQLEQQFKSIMLKTRVESMQETAAGIKVDFSAGSGSFSDTYEKVLVAVGRRPVTDGLGLENTQVAVDDHGFVKVDEKRQSTDPAIYAIGDVAGQPMLAHKATHEGRVAAEAIHNGKTTYEPRAIPAVVFTTPEIAWCGMTEDEARRAGYSITTGVFPWEASGRAATLGHSEGVTKIVADADDQRILGVGIAGHSAGELIGEGVLAIEMGAVAEDIALTIHAHPSLSETLMEAAERVMGQSTHFFQRM